jgi:hypothetical protein
VTSFGDRPFALLGVHIGGATVARLGEFMTKENLPWRSFVDPGNAGTGPIATGWCVGAMPTFYLLDHRGVIRGKWTGAPGAKVLDEAVEGLVREAERR